MALRTDGNVVRYVATKGSGASSEHHTPTGAARAAGKKGKVTTIELFTSGVAGKALGVTASTFRKYVDALEIAPHATYYSSPGGKGQHNALWSRKQVEGIAAADIKAALAAAKARQLDAEREALKIAPLPSSVRVYEREIASDSQMRIVECGVRGAEGPHRFDVFRAAVLVATITKSGNGRWWCVPGHAGGNGFFGDPGTFIVTKLMSDPEALLAKVREEIGNVTTVGRN